MRRRGFLVGSILLAVLGGLFYFRPWDPMELARRRVSLGEDEAAVAAAVGRPAEGAIGEIWREGEGPRRVVYWQRGDDYLFVAFDKDGRAANASVGSWSGPTLSERLRAWWPW